MSENKIQNAIAISFSMLMLLGILACVICDMAISGTFTWSLYPISSIIFAWLVFIPLIKLKKKGMLWSLAIFSILLIPFIYVVSEIACNNLIMPIGSRISFASVIYLWCGYLIFRKLKTHKMIAAAVLLILTMLLCIAINIILANVLSIPLFDIWDILSFAVIIVIAIVLLIIDLKKRRC